MGRSERADRPQVHSRRRLCQPWAKTSPRWHSSRATIATDNLDTAQVVRRHPVAGERHHRPAFGEEEARRGRRFRASSLAWRSALASRRADDHLRPDSATRRSSLRHSVPPSR